MTKSCFRCGTGPQIPGCDAKIHKTPRESASSDSHSVAVSRPARLQEQAKPLGPTPTRKEFDLSELEAVADGRRHLLEALEQNSAWRLRVVSRLVEEGVPLEVIGGCLGTTRQAVWNWLNR